MNANTSNPSGKTSAILFAVTFIAALLLTAGTYHSASGTSERALFWGIVLPWAAVARFPGAWLGEFLGFVGRHALGWFSAIIAGAIAVFILNYLQDPELLSMIIRLRTGLIPTATIYGIVAATIAETALTMLEMLLPRQAPNARSAQSTT